MDIAAFGGLEATNSIGQLWTPRGGPSGWSEFLEMGAQRKLRSVGVPFEFIQGPGGD